MNNAMTPVLSTSSSSSLSDDDKVVYVKMPSGGSAAPQTILTENDSLTTAPDSDDNSSQNSGGYTHPQYEYPEGDDDYADVRDRLEALARADRETHFKRSSTRSNLPSDGFVHAVNTPHFAVPFLSALTTYMAYSIYIVCGHFRDFCARLFGTGRYLKSRAYASDDETLYAPLLKSWENFYTRRIYHRVHDCFNRPVGSSPGATVDVLERESSDGRKTMELLDDASSSFDDDDDVSSSNPHSVIVHGRVAARRCLNLGSYNYLGFGDDWNETCAPSVLPALDDVPVSCAAPRAESGTTAHHRELEHVVADFLDREAAFVHNMGFNTNCTTLPVLVGKGDLLISDELNHTSIVNGARSSKASIRIFRHNDERHLEEILRDAIVMGRPRTRRPFNKILVVVEGVYSMEGEYCRLGPIRDVCKRYGAYIYLDEAHSIGAMGPTGRGCCEYWGVNDVDVLMGTFSKSFGGMGGYIAGKKELVDVIRARCSGSVHHNSLSPVICKQIITSFKIIMGADGTDIGRRKLRALRDNSNYFRLRLTEMGLQVLGDYDSPIMPILLYNPAKIAAFSRECYKRGLAVVVVGFPAVPILLSRARFCISAGHTRKDLDRAVREIDEIADLLQLRYKRRFFG